MDISRRLIGASAVWSEDNKLIDVDISGLIRRLLLFDKYVLISPRLREFPLLVKYFGYEGLQELLAAKLIEIRCECLQFGQTAQLRLSGQATFPLFSYRIDFIDASDRRKYLHDCLQNIYESPGLHRKQVAKLKRAVVGLIHDLPVEGRSEWGSAFQNDFLHNNKLVRTSIGIAIRSKLGFENVPFFLSLRQEDADIYSVETDLGKVLKTDDLETHHIVERGLLGIAGLSQTIGEMKAYSALSGYRDEELPLFRHKLDFLAGTVSSETHEHNFQRVMEIAELPDFRLDNRTIDVEKLLNIRDSTEIREFRDWLGSVGTASDKEVKDRVSSLRATLGLKTSGGTGKVLRFLATTAAGVAGPVVGVSVGAIDQFVVDRLLPRSGIAAFVNELYPSIFQEKGPVADP